MHRFAVYSARSVRRNGGGRLAFGLTAAASYLGDTSVPLSGQLVTASVPSRKVRKLVWTWE